MSAGPPTFSNTVTAFWAGDPSWSNPGNGNAVSSWRDYSGQGRDATQGTGANQPIYQSSASLLNNQPAVKFDGSLSFLNTASFTATSAGPHTVLIVSATDVTSTGVYRGPFCAVAGASREDILMEAVAVNKFTINNNSGQAGYTGPAQANSTAYTWRALWKSGAGSSALQVNGTGSSAVTMAPRSSLTSVYVGKRNDGLPWKGWIAYLAYIDADATADANWSSFVSWVSTTYGLTIA